MVSNPTGKWNIPGKDFVVNKLSKESGQVDENYWEGKNRRTSVNMNAGALDAEEGLKGGFEKMKKDFL